MRLRSLPTWLRAAVITAGQTFVGTFLVTLLGVLADVQEWLNDGPAPSLDAPAKAVLSAVVALAVGIVTAAYRALRPVQNTYPEPPTDPVIPPG